MVDGLVFLGLCGVTLGGLISLGLAEILGRAGLYIIKIDVRVGGSGVIDACLLAACVSDGLRVGAPSELLHASEGSHRALIRFAFDDVLTIVDALGCDIGNKGMSHGLNIMVPVAIIEVGHQSA